MSDKITTLADAQERIEALEERTLSQLNVLQARLTELERQVVKHEEEGWEM